MTSATSTATVLELARRFALDYRQNVSSIAYQETRYRNAQPEYAHGCATQEFLDANECMQFAFEQVIGRTPDGSSDADSALWNQAWDVARAEYLTAAPEEVAAWDSALEAYVSDLAAIHVWRRSGAPMAEPEVSEGVLQSLAGFHRDPRRS